MQVQELIGIVPWTFLAQICNLFIQVYLIRRFLLRPVNRMLEKRKAMADAQIQDAVWAKEEARNMKAEYEQNMLEAKNKANEILVTARKTAAVQSEKMLKEASAQAAAIREKAGKEIAQEKRKAVNEIKAEIGGMAMEIAEKVIEREICEEDHRKFIDAFLAARHTTKTSGGGFLANAGDEV